MATKKNQAAAPAVVAKKSGAAKKPNPNNFSVIEGGKGAEVVMLSDGKTPANRESLARALEKYEVKFDAKAPTSKLLELVRKELGKRLDGMSEDSMIKCENVCGEVSTEDTDFCPFCGDEGTPSDETGAGGDEGTPSDETGAAEAAEAVATTTAKTEETPPQPKAKAEKPAKGAKKPEPVTEITASTGGIEAAKKKLDASVARINELKTNLAMNSFDLGLELTEIYKDSRWKANGHDSFKTFVEKELDIGRTLAYRLIDIVKQFDRATFEKIGSKKLALISGITDSEARTDALNAAAAGASTKEIERHRAEANESGNGRTKPKAPSSSAKDKTAAPKKSGNEITLLAKVGSKPQVIAWRSAASGRPIQAHKDDAYAELHISENVKQRIALKHDKDGAIVGVAVSFIRVE